MSATTDFQALLDAAAPLAALVGTRIVSDRAEEGWPRPFVVYASTETPEYGLDNEVLAKLTTFTVQCCADTRRTAELVANAVTAAASAEAVVLERATGFDPGLDVEMTTLTIEWWED